ncbi:MAG: DUF488 domain-containing protein [Thermodesulfobacteriota bacterium]
MSAHAARSIFTIGHSNHPLQRFLELLLGHGVQVLADVRSRPYSRFAPQFNKKRIEESVAGCGIEYWFLGNVLGGKPKDPRFYDDDGRVVHARIARTPEFLEGITLLERRLDEAEVAIMCAEENPLKCHRNLMITPVLLRRGIRVRHIRGDGTPQEGARGG